MPWSPRDPICRIWHRALQAGGASGRWKTQSGFLCFVRKWQLDRRTTSQTCWLETWVLGTIVTGHVHPIHHGEKRPPTVELPTGHSPSPLSASTRVQPAWVLTGTSRAWPPSSSFPVAPAPLALFWPGLCRQWCQHDSHLLCGVPSSPTSSDSQLRPHHLHSLAGASLPVCHPVSPLPPRRGPPP